MRNAIPVSAPGIPQILQNLLALVVVVDFCLEKVRQQSILLILGLLDIDHSRMSFFFYLFTTPTLVCVASNKQRQPTI